MTFQDTTLSQQYSYQNQDLISYEVGDDYIIFTPRRSIIIPNDSEIWNYFGIQPGEYLNTRHIIPYAGPGIEMHLTTPNNKFMNAGHLKVISALRIESSGTATITDSISRSEVKIDTDNNLISGQAVGLSLSLWCERLKRYINQNDLSENTTLSLGFTIEITTDY